MPNSAVKRRSADGSVGSPHVRVGHCQALNTVETLSVSWGFLRIEAYLTLFAYIAWLLCLSALYRTNSVGNGFERRESRRSAKRTVKELFVSR
ncbi:hypothetical protein, partial [Photorhabdus akhurstii]|uniref:hypothetical protein n=1 Tax=Photorhabdus akhurstii TaxID=171438 RepID=UPI001BD6971D